MTRSVLVASAMLVIIAISSVISYYYTESVVEDFTARLEKAGSDPNKLSEISNDWNERKKPLMMIINHKDVENISVSLIRAQREAENGRLDMALEESDVAKFMLEELLEREKLSAENIF